MATNTQARDADGNALMSLEEMKEGMFQSIRDSGTVELIRAQLRRRFIEKLQQQCRPNNEQESEGNNTSQASRDAVTSPPDEKFVHGLVAEYLACKGLENTLAVFVPEIGGARNQVDSATILEMLHVNASIQNRLELERAQSGHSLLLVLVRELVRRFQLATMDSGTQTAMDCFDHRIVLENQLRRVENTYLAQCAAQKLEPQKSLEERMVQYQREYDDICEKRLQEELERFKLTEVALARAEERKRFAREVDSLRATLQQENHNKQERLQERERELELAFVARRTELETSLFETRQSLLKDMERLRVKEAELQVKVESDFRHFASETQRFQIWEESVRTQEANLESIVAQAMREKERAWQLERQQSLHDIQTKQDELSDRERVLTTETGTLKELKTQVVALQQEVAALEAALSISGDDLRLAQNAATQLEKEKQRLEERMADLELQGDKQNDNLNSASAVNARLLADKRLVEDEVSRYRQKSAEMKEQMKLLGAEVKILQQQILNLKLEEANAIVTERKKFMKLMDEERDQFQWKETELLTKMREMQSRLAECEARAEKYQSQYEDEKVHVESLRHDVANLNSLLNQAQVTINAKHVVPRDLASFRAQRSVSNDNYDSGDYQVRGGSERTFMMKMMEIMTNFQDMNSQQRNNNQRECAGFDSGRMISIPQETLVLPVKGVAPASQPSETDQEEAKRLKEDQDRIERELLEQRDYEKKKQARMQEQERELAEQHKQFEEKLARMRQERIEEEERLAEQRKRKDAEDEAKLQEDLTRQRAALQESTELQQMLAEQRLIAEQQRLQEEQAYQERRLAEELKFNEEVEGKRRQQQLEEELAAKQQQEREVEEERLTQERKAIEEREWTRLEKERKALEAARLKQNEEDHLRELELVRTDEERKRKEAEDEEQKRRDAAEDKSRLQEAGVEEKIAGNHGEDLKRDLYANQSIPSNVEGVRTGQSDEKEFGGLEETNDDMALPDGFNVDDERSSPDSANVSEVTEIEDNSAEVTPTDTEEFPAKAPEEEEQERQQTAEEAKKKEDEVVIDVYRQRVLARKAAEKQRQMEEEAATEAERKAQEAERQRLQHLDDASDSDHELELSGGSFAESSAASNSDSF